MAQKPITVSSQAQCLRSALGKISDVGKVHAFGIRSDVKVGDSLDIKSLWVQSKTGELEIKIGQSFKASREEVDAKIEVADEIVEQKDLETTDPVDDKIAAYSKLSDAPAVTTISTPIPDQVKADPTPNSTPSPISDSIPNTNTIPNVNPTVDTTCPAFAVAPHVEFGTVWTFDSNNKRVCNKWKEVYRKSECVENDVDGACTKESFSYDESAPRYQCLTKTTEAAKVQCVQWKIENGISVCAQAQNFGAVRACTDFTVENKQSKCAKTDLFYPKFRCVASMKVGENDECSLVEAVQPEFYCSQFTLVDGHRYCKTQSVYYGRRETTISCAEQVLQSDDNCELHCTKYQIQTEREEELIDFGNEFFVEITKKVETYEILRKVVIIPRPLTAVKSGYIHVTDVYIPVSSAAQQGERVIYPGQIKEFAGMFGALTVDKYESRTRLGAASLSAGSQTTTITRKFAAKTITATAESSSFSASVASSASSSFSSSSSASVASSASSSFSSASRMQSKGRKLISSTVYGRKLQVTTGTDADLVQAITSNLITFSASDRAILNTCF